MENERYQCRRAVVTLVERITSLETGPNTPDVRLEASLLGGFLTNMRLNGPNSAMKEFLTDKGMTSLIARTNAIILR